MAKNIICKVKYCADKRGNKPLLVYQPILSVVFTILLLGQLMTAAVEADKNGQRTSSNGERNIRSTIPSDSFKEATECVALLSNVLKSALNKIRLRSVSNRNLMITRQATKGAAKGVDVRLETCSALEEDATHAWQQKADLNNFVEGYTKELIFCEEGIDAALGLLSSQSVMAFTDLTCPNQEIGKWKKMEREHREEQKAHDLCVDALMNEMTLGARMEKELVSAKKSLIACSAVFHDLELKYQSLSTKVERLRKDNILKRFDLDSYEEKKRKVVDASESKCGSKSNSTEEKTNANAFQSKLEKIVDGILGCRIDRNNFDFYFTSIGWQIDEAVDRYERLHELSSKCQQTYSQTIIKELLDDLIAKMQTMSFKDSFLKIRNENKNAIGPAALTDTFYKSCQSPGLWFDGEKCRACDADWHGHKVNCAKFRFELNDNQKCTSVCEKCITGYAMSDGKCDQCAPGYGGFADAAGKLVCEKECFCGYLDYVRRKPTKGRMCSQSTGLCGTCQKGWFRDPENPTQCTKRCLCGGRAGSRPVPGGTCDPLSGRCLTCANVPNEIAGGKANFSPVEGDCSGICGSGKVLKKSALGDRNGKYTCVDEDFLLHGSKMKVGRYYFGAHLRSASCILKSSAKDSKSTFFRNFLVKCPGNAGVALLGAEYGASVYHSFQPSIYTTMAEGVLGYENNTVSVLRQWNREDGVSPQYIDDEKLKNADMKNNDLVHYRPLLHYGEWRAFRIEVSGDDPRNPVVKLFKDGEENPFLTRKMYNLPETYNNFVYIAFTRWGYEFESLVDGSSQDLSISANAYLDKMGIGRHLFDCSFRILAADNLCLCGGRAKVSSGLSFPVLGGECFEDTGQCTKCAHGYVVDDTGKSCEHCPKGKFINPDNPTQCIKCTCSALSSDCDPVSGACKSCPLGYYRKSKNAQKCIPCKCGELNVATGLSSPGECDMNTGKCTSCPIVVPCTLSRRQKNKCNDEDFRQGNAPNFEYRLSKNGMSCVKIPVNVGEEGNFPLCAAFKRQKYSLSAGGCLDCKDPPKTGYEIGLILTDTKDNCRMQTVVDEQDNCLEWNRDTGGCKKCMKNFSGFCPEMAPCWKCEKFIYESKEFMKQKNMFQKLVMQRALVPNVCKKYSPRTGLMENSFTLCIDKLSFDPQNPKTYENTFKDIDSFYQFMPYTISRCEDANGERRRRYTQQINNVIGGNKLSRQPIDKNASSSAPYVHGEDGDSRRLTRRSPSPGTSGSRYNPRPIQEYHAPKPLVSKKKSPKEKNGNDGNPNDVDRCSSTDYPIQYDGQLGFDSIIPGSWVNVLSKGAKEPVLMYDAFRQTNVEVVQDDKYVMSDPRCLCRALDMGVGPSGKCEFLRDPIKTGHCSCDEQNVFEDGGECRCRPQGISVENEACKCVGNLSGEKICTCDTKEKAKEMVNGNLKCVECHSSATCKGSIATCGNKEEKHVDVDADKIKCLAPTKKNDMTWNEETKKWQCSNTLSQKKYTSTGIVCALCASKNQMASQFIDHDSGECKCLRPNHKALLVDDGDENTPAQMVCYPCDSETTIWQPETKDCVCASKTSKSKMKLEEGKIKCLT